MARFLVLAAFSFLSLACANTPADHSSHLALYSWKPDGQLWHFALIPDPSPRSVSRVEVIRMAAPLVGLPALKSRLASTPRTPWAIMWRDDPPERTLQYPPVAIRRDIIAFAKQRGLNVEVWPSLYE